MESIWPQIIPLVCRNPTCRPLPLASEGSQLWKMEKKLQGATMPGPGSWGVPVLPLLSATSEELIWRLPPVFCSAVSRWIAGGWFQMVQVLFLVSLLLHVGYHWMG